MSSRSERNLAVVMGEGVDVKTDVNKGEKANVIISRRGVDSKPRFPLTKGVTSSFTKVSLFRVI